VEACKDAGVSPNQVGFVEAHGTGTAVGDPIEAHALSEALCHDRPVDEPLPIGSCKTNLGHLETAAWRGWTPQGGARTQPSTDSAEPSFQTPNPNIDFKKLKLRVPTAVEEFPETGSERIAGVNSFGFGGANAHVILAEPPPRPRAGSVKITPNAPGL
jgi:acyl transferase domain-containing protein